MILNYFFHNSWSFNFFNSSLHGNKVRQYIDKKCKEKCIMYRTILVYMARFTYGVDPINKIRIYNLVIFFLHFCVPYLIFSKNKYCWSLIVEWITLQGKNGYEEQGMDRTVGEGYGEGFSNYFPSAWPSLTYFFGSISLYSHVKITRSLLWIISSPNWRSPSCLKYAYIYHAKYIRNF